MDDKNNTNQPTSSLEPQTEVQSKEGTFLTKESESLSNDLPAPTVTDYSSIYQPVYTTSGDSAPHVSEQPSIPAEQVVHEPLQPQRTPVTPITENNLIEPKEHIVYKESPKGCGLVSDFFLRLLSCTGCLLFILSVIIIGLAIWVNF